MKTKFKIGDKVKVITGKEKGTIGEITTFFSSHSKVALNTIKPRTKIEKKKDTTPKIIPSTLAISNVMAWDSEKQMRSKIGYKFIEGKKKRYFKKSGIFLD